MISKFFVYHPIFATVLSILITLAGLISILGLPIAQYPEITPPTVQVWAIFPGANAQLVLDTVAAPIEQQISGVENLMYMSSQCTNDGMYNLMLTFKLGADPNMCQVLVQNRVQLAMPMLPDMVQREGVPVLKKSPSVMMIVNLISPGGRDDDVYLSNYATIQIRDELLRLPGVGDVTYLGQRDYSMRAWLDPEKLASLELTATDVISALSDQNIQVAAGQVGQQPAPRGQPFQLTMSALGRLTTPEQFSDIIVKVATGAAASPGGATTGSAGQSPVVIRLKDVARVELGARLYDQSCTLDGKPSVALSIYQLPGSNALQTAKAVYGKMEELSKRFPEGLEYKIAYDTTPFIHESIMEVIKTLRDAVILVAIVVLIFLQNWRATLIPLLAVPVAVVGTFAAMLALGFSLNNLSLFGLVLAIGIVVDDAIVVVENVERWMSEGLSPRDAAVKAMEEVTGPIIAVALVLTAVFVPCAFLSGITGQFFRQFALTIAVSTVISAFNSLTFSPAMAAVLLKPHGAKRDPLAWLLDMTLGWFFWLFNKAFNGMTTVYTRLVGLLLRLSVIVLVVYGGLLWLTYKEFTSVPTGFIPQQDKGYLLVNAQLPDAASVERTREVVAHIDRIAHEIPGVNHTVAVIGQSLILNLNAFNYGSLYVMLDEFDKRRGPEKTGDAIAAELRRRCEKEIQEAVVSVFGAPPVDGLGTTGGYKLIVENRANLPLTELQKACDDLCDAANKTAGLSNVFTGLRADTPWLYLDIDRTKVRSEGILMEDVFATIQTYVGSYYVNNFNDFGRSWQVNIQADARFRGAPEDILKLKVRNSQGQMVPLATLAQIRDSSGPVMLMRYNMYSAAPINGSIAPGYSSGEAVTLFDKLTTDVLPPSMIAQWTELTYLQILAGNSAMYVFALAVLLVFLVLAAQYESWALPLAVILVVPMCLLCSVEGVAWASLDINIFTQIGFVVLVGLASKNAILIVEFAKQKRELGSPRREATLEACRLRLRPILMTSFAFILGVVPLVVASGAGAEMRHALGTAVFAGMLGVTLFGVFLTPVFFNVIDMLAARQAAPPSAPVSAPHVEPVASAPASAPRVTERLGPPEA
jgi:hydrophobe/amphiphile efflux-1 (HAE1) family protein